MHAYAWGARVHVSVKIYSKRMDEIKKKKLNEMTVMDM